MVFCVIQVMWRDLQPVDSCAVLRKSVKDSVKERVGWTSKTGLKSLYLMKDGKVSKAWKTINSFSETFSLFDSSSLSDLNLSKTLKTRALLIARRPLCNKLTGIAWNVYVWSASSIKLNGWWLTYNGVDLQLVLQYNSCTVHELYLNCKVSEYCGAGCRAVLECWGFCHENIFSQCFISK